MYIHPACPHLDHTSKWLNRVVCIVKINDSSAHPLKVGINAVITHSRPFRCLVPATDSHASNAAFVGAFTS